MGFLLGAFGKLAASQRKRSIQAAMMRIQSKLRIATRQISNYSKMIENNKKSELNELNVWANGLIMATQTNVSTQMNENPIWQAGQQGKLTDQGQIAAFNQMATSYTQQLTQVKSQIEATKAMKEEEIKNKYEYMNDMLLEPIRMEEEALQLENDSLKSQLAIAEEDYKACEQMEQAGAKDLAPKYVAGGGG